VQKQFALVVPLAGLLVVAEHREAADLAVEPEAKALAAHGQHVERLTPVDPLQMRPVTQVLPVASRVMMAASPPSYEHFEGRAFVWPGSSRMIEDFQQVARGGWAEQLSSRSQKQDNSAE
jgi:hypothetical protein